MSIKSSVSDFLKLDELKENIFKLVESKFELKKLEVYGEIEKKLGPVIYNLLLFLFLFLVFLFLNILVAALVNYWQDSVWLGYAVLITFYLILYFIFRLNKENILKSIRAKIADLMMQKEKQKNISGKNTFSFLYFHFKIPILEFIYFI